MTAAGIRAGSVGSAARVALVMGTSNFGEGFEPLQRVPDELRMVKAVLAESAGCTIHRDSGLDPTVQQLRSSLERALHGDDGVPPDLLIFYYSGHGREFGDGDFLLAARDSEKEEVSTQLRADELFALLTADGRPLPREVVMLVDTCHAGLAVTRFGQELALKRAIGSPLPVFTAFGAVDRLHQAHQLHFTDSFAAALRTVPGSEREEFLRMEVLHEALVGRMKHLAGDQGVPPEPEFLPPGGATRAFYNPWYLSGKVRRPKEANEVSGWAFCGRGRAVDAILAHLNSGDAAGALAVTGDSGSGKSVLLDWVHTGSSGKPLRAGPRAPAPVPLECLDLLLDVRGMPLALVVKLIASHYKLGTEWHDAAGLLDRLAAGTGTLTMCFDSIDACVDPYGLYTDLLAPLAALDRTRVILAGHGVPDGFTGSLIDLDSTEFSDPAGIAEFVGHVLRHRMGTTWAETDPQWVTDIAGAAAEAAGGSWLRAYLFAVSLSAEDPGSARVRAERTTAELFLEQLRALDEDDPEWAAQLLLPVALAQGEGLPADGQVWAAVAERTSGRKVGAAELERVQLMATDFLAAPEGGLHRNGWRFERSPNAEALVHMAGRETAHTAFVQAMTHRLPLRPSGARDWTAADRYTREHFVHHAEQAGVLLDYLREPEFLLMMNSDALQRVLTVLQDDPRGEVARVRSLCKHLARTNRTDGQTLSRLALLAQVYRLPVLARRAGESAVGWRPHLVHTAPVTSVHCLPDGGDLVLDEEGRFLLRRGSEDVGVWETLASAKRTAPVSAASVIDANGSAMFAGQVDGRAWAERLSDGEAFAVPNLALDCRLVTCVQSETRNLLIAGTDGWHWRTPESTGRLVPRGRLRIGGAATAVYQGIPMVATRSARDVTVWRADGQLVGSFEPAQHLALAAIAADCDGVYTGAGDGTVWLTSWNLDPVGQVTAHASQVVEIRVRATADGRALVSAGQRGDIRLTPLPLGSGTSVHFELGIDVSSVDVDTCGDLVVGTSAGVVRVAH
ncbi:caspase family protein [Streptomyces sp. NPDC056883]|uniref:caspase family protein n=1 Tax=Streptomyces sp. NPDC056883 TaxID=3345959 RepID=UPI00369BAFE1